MTLLSIFKKKSPELTYSQFIQKLKTDQQYVNQLNEVLYRFIKGTPMWLDDSPTEYIEKGYVYNQAVYSVVNAIHRNAAQVHWHLYEVKDEKAFSKYKAYTGETRINNIIAHTLQHKSLKEVEGHRLNEILQRPNPMQGWNDWFKGTLGYKLILGNSYIFGAAPEDGPNKGLFQELYTMPAQHVQIVGGTPLTPIEGYKFTFSEKTINPELICHLKYWNPSFNPGGTNNFYGLSPLRAASKKIKILNDNDTAEAKLKENIGAIGLFTDESTDAEPLTPEQASQVERKFKEKYQGVNNYGSIIVTAAKLKWQSMGMSATDLNILESNKFTFRDICNIYGYPSQLLNDAENKSYNTHKEAKKEACTSVILPELDAIKDELNRWLVGPYNKKEKKNFYLDYDIQAIPELQDNFKEQVDALKEAWWIKTSEKRIFQGYEEDSSFPEIVIPSTLIPYDGNQNIEDSEEAKKYLSGDKL